MKLIYRFLIAFAALPMLVSCVKNEPFQHSYSVPAQFKYDNTDSSAKAGIIMMHGVQNYLATGANGVLKKGIVDSLLWNRDSSFTTAMVPNFVFTADILNRMVSVNLLSTTVNADSIKAYADSTVAISSSFNVAASNGVAGWKMQSAPISARRLFSSKGIAYNEVWAKSMLGAMALNSVFAYLNGAQANGAWELAYDYTGMPQNYDPSKNYETEPVPVDRPLSIAGYFSSIPDSLKLGAKIYEEFRRGKAAIFARDTRVSAASVGKVYSYLEKTLAVALVTHLDAAKQYTDIAGKLNELSKAYGIAIALKYRFDEASLSQNNYWLLRSYFNDNFYTLVQDVSYKKINAARALLVTAYSL